MRRVNTRGIEGANKHVLMAALTYNLKKYLHFINKKVNTKVMVEAKPLEKALSNKYMHLQNQIRAILSQLFFTLNPSPMKIDKLN